MDQLCDVCASIDFKRLLIQPQIDDKNPWDYRVQHHTSTNALRKAAASGCRLCSLLLDAHERAGLHDPEPGSEHEMYPFAISAYDDFRHDRHAACPTIGYGPQKFLSGLLYLPLAVRTRTAHPGCNTGLVDEGRPDYELFKTWIKNCLGSHTMCMKSGDDLPMPTRLLDTGNVPTQGMVRFIESQGMSGDYVALSHI